MTLDGIEIRHACRWGKNGRFYHWDIETEEDLRKLTDKYPIEQIVEETGTVWLQW